MPYAANLSRATIRASKSPECGEPTELIAGAFKGEVKPPRTYGYSH